MTSRNIDEAFGVDGATGINVPERRLVAPDTFSEHLQTPQVLTEIASRQDCRRDEYSGTMMAHQTAEQTMNQWMLLAIAIIGECVATSALKASEGFTRLAPSVLVVVGYGLAFYFLSLTLRIIPVGIAYAIWSGVGVVLISAIAWLFFGQRLDLPALAGMGLIVAGVVVINVFSKVSAH